LQKTPPQPLPDAKPAPLRREPATARRVALVGFGTVGRAVAKILCERSDRLLQLTHICNRNVERKKQLWVPDDVVWTEDFQTVLNSDADIVIELIGGLTAADELVRSALKAGKSVVTANKQLIARHGPDLLQLASANGCQLEFGASVAGGVPVLPALRTGLCGDRLHGVAGILNGTCNYILSRIETDRIPFSEALEEAQARGYAEADASEDLDGGDARAKLSILALAGLRVRVAPGDIRARTIRPIDAIDFDYAAELGCTIRQISRADLKDATLFADVGALRAGAEESEFSFDFRRIRRRHGFPGRGRRRRSHSRCRGFRPDVHCGKSRRGTASTAAAAIRESKSKLRF
jgi:homoserine dehydrogenase